MQWNTLKLHRYIRKKGEKITKPFYGQNIPFRILLRFGNNFSPCHHQKSHWLFGVGFMVPCSGAMGYHWEGQVRGSSEGGPVPSCYLRYGKKGWNPANRNPNFPVLAVNRKMEEWLGDYKSINFSPCSVQQRLLLMVALKNLSFLHISKWFMISFSLAVESWIKVMQTHCEAHMNFRRC